MTIGQRIAQNRKELGLSQEALGDQLGVSRQSIYKWESDSALPEIDKLIALSRLFGVSVGALLGVEEAPEPETVPAGELTEQQLKMVEEIVARYLAAQPKPKPRRKWLWVLAGFAVLAGVFSLINRLDQINQQYQRVQMTVSNVQDSVDAQINGISDRVEEILKAQNDLTADYATEVIGTDPAANIATFSFRAIPKTFSLDMIAWLEVKNESTTLTFGPYEPSGQTFSGEVAVPLTDDISLYIVFESGGQRQTQLLDTYGGLYSQTLPDVEVRDWHLFAEDVPGGTLALESFYITSEIRSGEVAELKVGLFRNQKLLAWATPCAKPENYQGYENEDFHLLPDMTVENLTEEDVLHIAALVTDAYGRQFMACDIPYIVEFDTDRDAPYLTYPSNGTYDSNPANWTFD